MVRPANSDLPGRADWPWPHNIDDQVLTATSKNPVAIVRRAIIVVHEPRLKYHCDHGLPVLGRDIEVDILAVPDLTRICHHGESAAHRKWNAAAFCLADDFAVAGPSSRRKILAPRAKPLRLVMDPSLFGRSRFQDCKMYRQASPLPRSFRRPDLSLPLIEQE